MPVFQSRLCAKKGGVCMGSEPSCRLVPKPSVILAAVVAIAFGGVILADDYEDPVAPPGPFGGAPTVAFGDSKIEPKDVGGLAIDAKEALEPQVTVMLIVEDGGRAPGETVAVQAWPTFSGWVTHPDSP